MAIEAEAGAVTGTYGRSSITSPKKTTAQSTLQLMPSSNVNPLTWDLSVTAFLLSPFCSGPSTSSLLEAFLTHSYGTLSFKLPLHLLSTTYLNLLWFSKLFYPPSCAIRTQLWWSATNYCRLSSGLKEFR